MKKNIRQVSTSSNFQLKNWDLHTSTFIPCITNTDCTAAWINSKAFYFDSNTQYLSQCDFSPPISPSTNPTITNCNNMLGHEVALSSLKISFQDSFAQITLKIYDINHIVYPAAQPFELVSGVLTKFIN